MSITNNKWFTPHYFFNRDLSFFRRRCVAIVFRSKNVFGKKSAGFTLIEVIVSVFIFLIIMMSVSQIFASAFMGYRSAKAVQQNLEVAQFAINTMAKELRASSVVSDPGEQNFMQFYDHSQGICFRYKITGTELKAAKITETAATESLKQQTCEGRVESDFSNSFTTIASGINGDKSVFSVTPSVRDTPQVIGKVTVSLTIGEETVPRPAHIQTTASLRDYGNVGM